MSERDCRDSRPCAFLAHWCHEDAGMLRRPARLKELSQELSVRASEVVFEPYGGLHPRRMGSITGIEVRTAEVCGCTCRRRPTDDDR